MTASVSPCSLACSICQRRSEETLSAECRSTVCPVRNPKKKESLCALRQKLVKEPEKNVASSRKSGARGALITLFARRALEKKKKRHP